MSVELKVKAKTLAAEARIIRKEELRRKGGAGTERESLCNHRRGALRREARLTHLARGFLRNHPYRALEASVRPEKRLVRADILRIGRMIAQYGRQLPEGELETWLGIEAEKKAA